MASSTKSSGSNNDKAFTLPPAYDLHRSDRINGGESNTRPPSSFATTEDSINSSLDYHSSSSPGADEQYEGFRRVGGGEIETSIGLVVPPSSQFAASNNNSADQDPSQLLQDIVSHNHHHGENGSIDDRYYPSNDGNEMSSAQDATATIHNMHTKLLYLLSHPELFHEALSWEDHSLSIQPNDKFEEDSTFEGLSDTNNNHHHQNNKSNNVKATQDETFEFNPNDQGGGGGDTTKEHNNNDDYKEENDNSPPLPFDIFAPDAEVVLPQALTATQLFGMERVTGIELEAAAGITGLSHLFQRWLALMPEGDHMNIIRPPGLTVMRISGGRYRVTAAHRVVWRWMNKFSFSDAMFQGPSDLTDTAAPGDEEGSNDTDFDFGDLVTMTIIDVFETDVDGRLLSYCPTFDNRAVHKTQETVERIKKGATQFKERIEVVKKSPAGQSAQHVAEDLGKRGLSAAFKGFTLVKNRIETEIHNRQHPKSEEKTNVAASTASSDAVGGEDIGDEASEK
mmetsp:Transcript_13428/g.20111  ORF Transcript_13428/g.20111 Transcript_13428/m.20111 type:complete len:509 (+) Transcript_13428:38-1564(+)